MAASVPHWTAESATEYLSDLWKVVDGARPRVQRVMQTGKQAYDDLMGWFAELGMGHGSGIEGDE